MIHVGAIKTSPTNKNEFPATFFVKFDSDEDARAVLEGKPVNIEMAFALTCKEAEALVGKVIIFAAEDRLGFVAEAA